MTEIVSFFLEIHGEEWWIMSVFKYVCKPAHSDLISSLWNATKLLK